MKKGVVCLTVVIFLCSMMMFSTAEAQSELSVEKFIDPKIPKSWYEAPKSASEMGISSFKESPMLAERVKAGELPAVNERLPEDPPVLEPYEKVGKHGGTVVVWAKADYRGNTMYFKWPEKSGGPGRPTPDGRAVVPNLLEKWEYSPDGKELTMYLIKGLKWSDGVPMTADDFMYWWDHVAFNEELNPIPPTKLKPIPCIASEKVDDYTVKFTFEKANPRFHEFNFYVRFEPVRQLDPAHYMKQFHPAFAPQEEIEAMAKKAGLETWADYYRRISIDSPDHPEYEHQRPVLRQYIVTEREETYMIWERNPYWPFVDTAGNQLPYIDKVRVNIASKPEIAAAKAATGETDLAARFVQTPDIPLYKKNEAKGKYHTNIYHRVYGTDVSLMVNLTHQDPEMREVFQDVRFRRALSHAIDRNEINKKVYFGQAIVMQNTIPPVSKYFKEEYAKAFVDYDPEKAKALLDEMGVVDKNGDGLRDLPSGKKLNPTITFTQVVVNPTPVVELFLPMLEAVGLKFEAKFVNRSLHDTSWAANNLDAHVFIHDQLVDTAFGGADKDFAPAGVSSNDLAGKDSPWPAWTRWYVTNGEKGMEPPDNINQLVVWRDILGNDPDPAKRDEAAHNLLKAQAENLWGVGTVAMAPHPVIVSNRLRNVPDKGIWDWRCGYMYAYYPMQFYLDE